jgi:hypothetical protein
MLLYSWSSNHDSIYGTSQITGASYSHAPPDFYFFDASSLRVGDYIGDYGGNLNQNSIGTIPDTVGYEAPGGICPWAYGADTIKNPVEAPFVDYGPYPGSGILWLSPEMSTTKNPNQDSFGNDTVARYGAEVRRFVLHQTDIAQPYVRWQPATVGNNTEVYINTPITFAWQVNGSIVVDHTNVQYGINPDPIHLWSYDTTDHDEHSGDYEGGTGWDGAMNGQTSGVTYTEYITLTVPGDYYFVAKAQVDQVYKNVLRPDVYGTNPYLRIITERTNDSYYEVLHGTDGIEEIIGQTWWYSSIIHIKALSDNDPPNKPQKPSGEESGKVGKTYKYTTSTTDPNGDDVYFMWDWGDGNFSEWIGPYQPGATASAQKSWTTKGSYSIKVKAKDRSGLESSWSDPLPITMPTSKNAPAFPILSRLIQNLLFFFQVFLK